MGRSIFADLATAWFAGTVADADVVAGVARRYARLIALWQQARAGASATVQAA